MWKKKKLTSEEKLSKCTYLAVNRYFYKFDIKLLLNAKRVFLVSFSDEEPRPSSLEKKMRAVCSQLAVTFPITTASLDVAKQM